MAVLCLYNGSNNGEAIDSLSESEIQTGTGIPTELLKQVLAILCKARVLLQDGEGENFDLNPSKCFCFHHSLHVITNLSIINH